MAKFTTDQNIILDDNNKIIFGNIGALSWTPSKARAITLPDDTGVIALTSQIPTDYVSDNEMTTISGDIISYVDSEIDTISGAGESNTASNVGAGEGVFKQKTSTDLEFRSLVAGDNITLVSSADTITISGSGGGAQGPTKFIVTVGSSGADYDNFDDAIDYLRALNGGTILVTSNMTITSTAIKDITNITIDGDKFFAGTRQINKTANGGYWYGKNVVFKNIWFYRIFDAGANEIFRFTEDFQDVTLFQVNLIGLGGFNSPKVFNCNGKQSYIVANFTCGLSTADWGWVAFGSPSTLVLCMRDRCSVYLASESVDACWYDSSCVIEGTPTWGSPKYPVMIDKTSAMENDSSVTGDTVKDALENLNEKNGIDGTFTTNDGKTITVVDGQITSIV